MAESFDRLINALIMLKFVEKMGGGGGGAEGAVPVLQSALQSLQSALSSIVDKVGVLVDRVAEVKLAVTDAVQEVKQVLDEFRRDAAKIAEKLDQLAQSKYVLVRVKDVYAPVLDYTLTTEVVGE